MKKAKSVTEALDQTVEARIKAWEEGISPYDAAEILFGFYGCPLCRLLKAEQHFSCSECPFFIVTGVRCYEHDKYSHFGDLITGVSLILAIQYYWNNGHPKKLGR